MGFFGPPLAVKIEGEVGTRRIFYFTVLSPSRIHYTPIQVLMRRRTGSAAESVLSASVRPRHRLLSCTLLAIECV